MDDDFLAYYKNNLAFLRQRSEVFAQQYPKIAQNLGLSAFECADPFVERVLEGVAFLSARNEQKLDQGNSLILQDLLHSLAPALAMPHPALANIQLPANARAQSSLHTIALATQFKTTIQQVSCKFSALFAVNLCPITFTDPQQHYQLEDLLGAYFDSHRCKSALSLAFSIYDRNALPDDVDLFLNMPELEAGLLAKWLTMNLTAIVVQDPKTAKIYPLHVHSAAHAGDDVGTRTSNSAAATAAATASATAVGPTTTATTAITTAPARWSSASMAAMSAAQQQQLQAAGLSPEVIAQAFYPVAHAYSGLADGYDGIDGGDSGFANAGAMAVYLSILHKPNLLEEILSIGKGMSLLSLYSVYPQLCKYLFFKGLGTALAQLQSKVSLTSGRLIFVFDTLQPKLNLGAQIALTNVVPMLNVFPKRCSYTQMTLRSYYHLIPERTAPDDYEVLSISSVELLGTDHAVAYTAWPYFSRSLDPQQLFFILQRQERAKGTYVPRSAYPKSESFVAFCSADFKPLLSQHLNVVANTYCSNADLPVFLRQGVEFSSLDDTLTGHMLDSKLQVYPALITRSNNQSYALLAYFKLHVNSLLEQGVEQIKLSLQELLKAYAAPHGDLDLELLAHALIRVDKKEQTFRFIQQGIVFFEQGIVLKLYFDPEKSGGSSLFFLARILCSLLQQCVSLNQHCRVVAYTKQGEELATC